MDNFLEEHLSHINNLTKFLKDYSQNIKKNIKKFQNLNLSENFYLTNINIENLKDRLLEILSKTESGCNYNNTIKNELEEYNLIQQNIKEISPILLYYFINKKSFSYDQEVPSALLDL